MKLLQNVLGGVVGKVGGLVRGIVIPKWVKGAAIALLAIILLSVVL